MSQVAPRAPCFEGAPSATALVEGRRARLGTPRVPSALAIRTGTVKSILGLAGRSAVVRLSRHLVRGPLSAPRLLERLRERRSRRAPLPWCSAGCIKNPKL
jgi:hypothetical protein